MIPTHLIDIATVEALLARLDPEPDICNVPGCVHQHDPAGWQERVPAIAA